MIYDSEMTAVAFGAVESVVIIPRGCTHPPGMRMMSTAAVVRYWSYHTAGKCELHTTGGGTTLLSVVIPA